MLALEIVSGKDEMRDWEFAAAFGAGTSLLLRLNTKIPEELPQNP